MEYVIGVDIGTTSTKAIAFDLKGNIISKKNIEYPVLNPKPSWSEQDPDEIFNAVLNAIKNVVFENFLRHNELLGISFSSAMHSVIAVDSNGEKMTNCIIWADTRSSEYAAKIKESKIGHEVYMRTGTPVHPMSPLCKLAWMKDNMKEIYYKAYKFISIKEYAFYKLFGVYIVDYSIASATGLFDIYNLKWDTEALKIAGISEDKLSRPVPTTYIVKGLKDIFAKILNIDKDTPFIIGASDGCLSNLGTNAIKSGNAAVTIGTSGAIRIVTDKPRSDSHERLFNYILTEKHFVLGGSINNGGIVFRWFRDNFSLQEVKTAKEMDIDTYDLLTEKASKIPAGSDGLIFLPYLLGERAPYWDACSRGVFFGINIKHTREHFIRALLEGVIYGIYDVGKALEETMGNIDTIYATGGFARSHLWVQILADVFDKKVLIAESYESSCLGAAVLGMWALGLIEEIEDVENMVPISNEYIPDEKNHKIYIETFKIYSDIYKNLKDDFRRVAQLQA